MVNKDNENFKKVLEILRELAGTGRSSAISNNSKCSLKITYPWRKSIEMELIGDINTVKTALEAHYDVFSV